MKKIILGAIFFVTALYAQAQGTDKQTRQANEQQVILIETSLGNMKAILYDETPLHRANFLKLISEGFYDSLLFHRVIPQFMIQGGDPDSRHAQPGVMLGSGNLGYTIPAEFSPKLFHKRGALCAARMGDAVNPSKASSASQFYIVQGRQYSPADMQNMAQRLNKTFSEEQIQAYANVGGTPFLDGEYTVFGEIIEGFDVLDRIASVPRNRQDRPLEDVIMKISLLP